MHPMGEGVKDPRSGGEVGCLSCHDPHGTGYEYMLVDTANGRLCVGCHTDKIKVR
jgi:predicted CXXCH cytochrome family protein